MERRAAILRVCLVVVIACAACYFVITHWGILREAGTLLLSRGWLFALCVPLAAGFLACKGQSLRAGARAASLSVSSLEAIRLVAEGAAIEAISWPGKVVADTFRVVRLGESDLPDRIRAILAWRLAGTSASAGVVLLAALTLALQEAAPLQAVATGVALALAFALGVWRLRRRLVRSGPLLSRGGFRSLARSAAWSVLAAMCDVSAMSVVAWQLADAAPDRFAPRFVVVSMLGALSMLPLGAGVLDAGCWFVLCHQMGCTPAAASAVVICYRVLGPGLTLLAGGVSMACRASNGTRSVVLHSLSDGRNSLHCESPDKLESPREKPPKLVA